MRLSVTSGVMPVTCCSGREARAPVSRVPAPSGGFTVPTIFAAPILDLAANQTRVVQAGTRVVPMSSQIVKVGRLDTDPTPSWRAEAAAIAEASATFGQVTLTAKSLAVHVRVSLEVLEDANPTEFGSILGTSLARSFAVELDRAALYGSGASNQPLGLKGQAGVAINHYGPTPPNANGAVFSAAAGWYGPIVDGVARLRTKNYNATGMLYSERTAGQFGKAFDTSNQPLVEPFKYLSDVPQYSTGQIPGGSDRRLQHGYQ